MKTEREEKLWGVEEWKSKSGIPTFPPPREPAAQGKDHLMKEGVNAMMRRPAAARRLWEDISRPPGSLRLAKPTDRRHQDHCPENGLLSCHGPVDSAYGALCSEFRCTGLASVSGDASVLAHRNYHNTRSPALRSKGGHFYFALT